MGSAHLRSASAARLAATLGVCVGLSCCVSDADEASGRGALFKSQVANIAGGVAPGPNSVWYVENRPIRYVKIGVATWRPRRSSHGLRSWIARLFGRHAPADGAAEPTAIAAAGLGLPVPSHVQVTNLLTGEMITVRVNDKAPMSDGVIRLAPSAARGLGADPAKPLFVRVRYLAPAMTYDARPSLRYVLRGPIQPAASPPVVLAQAPAAAPPPVAAPQPPAIIHLAATEPPAPAPEPDLADIARALRPERSPAPVGGVFRIQVGAFANLANARRAVGLAAPAGAGVIEPVKRGALTLYRVIVPAPLDAAAAERLRARLSQIGFADARLIKTL